MSWSPPFTFATLTVLTANQLNKYLRDNLNETAVGKTQSAGDLIYASGSKALTRLAAPGSSNPYKYLTVASGLPSWSYMTDNVLNAQSLLDSTAASITVPASGSLPQTFNHLRIRIMARIHNNAFAKEVIWLRVNGDTGNNYDYTRFYANNSAATVESDQFGKSHISIGEAPESNTFDLYFLKVIIEINNYTGTTAQKIMHIISSMETANSAGNLWYNEIIGCWNSTSAITSFNIAPPAGGNLELGSSVYTYGLN